MFDLIEEGLRVVAGIYLMWLFGSGRGRVRELEYEGMKKGKGGVENFFGDFVFRGICEKHHISQKPPAVVSDEESSILVFAAVV